MGSGMMYSIENALRDASAAEYAGDSSQAGPRCIASQPEAWDANIMRNRLLVGIFQRQAYTANSAIGTRDKTFVGIWRTYFVDLSVFPKLWIDAPCKLDQTLSNNFFLQLVCLRR